MKALRADVSAIRTDMDEVKNRLSNLEVG